MRCKALRRFFVEEIRVKEGHCLITGPEARHISKVLRMGPGERLILMDNKGTRFLALIESVSSREVRVTLEKPIPKPIPSPVKIVLCQALLKSRAMDYVIQKTSELGVDSIIPFASKRTVVRFEKERLANRMRHWHEIAQASAKQSDRDRPAVIDPVLTFSELITKWQKTDSLKIILWEDEPSRDLKAQLRASSPTKQFVVMVGPEGGFGREEVEAARNAGFIPVSMGNRVLRAETAAMTLVGIVQYEWGDLGLL